MSIPAPQPCTIETQRRFGPSNPSCYDGLDFTLFFEEIFLSIVPVLVVLPTLIWRITQLRNAVPVVGGRAWHIGKQVISIFREQLSKCNSCELTY